MKSLTEIIKSNPQIAKKALVIGKMSQEERAQLLEKFLSSYPQDLAAKLREAIKQAFQNPENPLDDNTERLITQALLAVEVEQTPAALPPISQIAGRIRPT